MKEWRTVGSVVVVLGFLLVFALFGQAMYDQWQHDCPIADRAEQPLGWQYRGDVANRWQAVFACLFGFTTAVFSYMLWRVSDMQRKLTEQQKKLLEKDIGISEQALAEARENSKAALIAANAARDSAEALISSERGTLIYEGASREQMLSFLFLVAGKQPITLIAMCHHFQFANDEVGVVAVEDMGEWDTLGVNVGPGDHWGAWRGEAERLMEAPSIPIPIDVWNTMREGNEHLVVSLRMLYNTTFGRYVQTHTFMFTEGHGTVTLWRTDLTHEWRAADWRTNFEKAREENRDQGEFAISPPA